MVTLKKQKLLVIAPHPDDEVLGCGGLIKKIKDHGGRIYVLFLSVGATKDFSRKGESRMKERQKEIEKVARFLKFDDYHVAFTGSEHHLKLDVVGQREIIHIIERGSPVAIERVKPTIVAFPSPYSYNQDHQLAARASHAALRPAGVNHKHYVPIVLAYEMPADGWSLGAQHVPNFFVPLTKEELQTKSSALRLYQSQLRPMPNPRSPNVVMSLAKLRGSLCGTRYAEAFIAQRVVLQSKEIS